MKNRKVISTFLAVVLCMSACSGVFAEQNTVYAAEIVSNSAISFYASEDGTGEKLPDLMGVSSVSAKAEVSNRTGENKHVGLYLAYYDSNGCLIDVEHTKEEIISGRTVPVTVGMKIDSIAVGEKVRSFLWDMTDCAMMPLVKDESLYATNDIYVAVDGDNEGSGTFVDPLKTVDAAQKRIRQRNDDMTTDLSVYLREGTYYLPSALSFGTEDSGTNGYRIHYRSYGDEEAILSGAKVVNNWSLVDKEKRIFCAEAANLENVRELFVNGKKAQRAKSQNRIYPQGFYTELVNGTETISGYVVSAEDIDLYKNAEKIQLHYTRIWKNTLCNVDEILPGEEGTYIIKMDSKAFSIATDAGSYVPLTSDISFYIENAYELLDEDNEFYYDGTNIYYKAEENEVVTTAQVPVLETLMEVKGNNLQDKVKNISFEGITFAHTTRSDIDEGYLGDQAQSLTPLEQQTSSYPLDSTIVGADVRVHRAENLIFEGNTFTGLSSVGLGLYDGADNITITGNRFYDLGDSAITVGLPTDAYMDMAYEAGRNVALHKPVVSCGAIRTNATYANDGNRKTIWENPNNLISDYWQVDLGKPYTINEIRVKARLGATDEATETYRGQEVHRQDFQVWGSNDPLFADGGVLLATQGSPGFDFDAGFVGKVEITDKFQYIRFNVTKNKYFPLAELEVISRDDGAPMKEVCRNSRIANNYITRIGDVNWGAPGIQLYYTEAIDVAHNVIKDVPYSGICAGWGWLNTTDSVTAKNNVIRQNIVDGFAQKMYDAGGIYLLGTQQNTQVIGNYIKGQKNLYYAFYADSGSEDFTVTDNVFENVDMVFALGREGNPTTQKGMTVKNNYTTTPCYTYSIEDGSDNVVEAPMFFIKGKDSEQVILIKENAGLESAYIGLTIGIPSITRTLSFEELYGNVVDRHVERLTDTIGSLSDVNLIHYYLNNKIEEADKVLAAGKEFASDAAIQELENAISEAKQKWLSYLEQTKNESGQIVHTTKNLNRKTVLETRDELVIAIEAFVDSLSK
ncbi:MAG: hypothetical protein II997_01065 [Clostridia bacterium]|nr:hypothetical protein [Clostridia bacterium]